MDYPFEMLDPERFQKFSQALITREYSDVQCFPVAQPDGGRDAIAYLTDRPGRGFIMYQIKFVRNPFVETDPHQWLLRILKQEAPKLKQQIPAGAKQYVLITNVSGTAHLDKGAIDKLNKVLNDELGVPSICWWRDDIARRLDNAWDLKWIYPELMTGPDLIRSVIEQGLSEDRERRSSALRAFIKDQFDKDQEVRFKQVDLQNRLFDLFIDVPIVPPQYNSTRRSRLPNHHIYRSIIRDISLRTSSSTSDTEIFEDPNFFSDTERDYFWARDEKSVVGAATLILHPLTQKYVSCMVLEGAPGQGKSTIAQYISQVHRIKVLGRPEINSLPVLHKNAPARIPFKVDLRDFATWLAKRNPFSSEEGDIITSYWQKSLESFLAAQVRYHSGGIEFDVQDFIAVAKLSSIILVFDGLDEVADIGRRREVVDEIIRGVSRVEENAASLQVIVTSRPAAFANSPGLPEDRFPYFHLGSVTRSLTNEYADKWLRARRLHGREASDVKKILQEKLDQPHLRDLARNTMQLTILLSLIHTRGVSLPDKRTALYDSYVELFFNRESEKSAIVRDHRDLLVNIHRYLAWLLHIESEQGNNTGSITEERLHVVLSEYLVSEGYDSSLASILFTGMVERVVALVSRVEGTYEFEVQPLREYFAARYLYETAPYSPPGNERKGTKPDRFNAIARNFYWLNVARFYAGCYSKGELSSLIDCLQDLVSDRNYRLLNHPRSLAAMLLSDWVFTQHPKSVHEVVELILDGIGLRYLLASGTRRGASISGGTFILSKQNGRDELISRCFKILQGIPPRDYALGILELVRSNVGLSEIRELWYETTLIYTGYDRNQWIEYGLSLGVLARLTSEELDFLLSDQALDTSRLVLLCRARQFEFIESDPSVLDSAIEAVLSREIVVPRQQRIQSVVELLSHGLDGFRYAVAFRSVQPISLSSIWESETRGLFTEIDDEKVHKIFDGLNNDNAEKCLQFIKAVRNGAKILARNWASEIAPWESIVELARDLWGERWAFYHIANISGGIKSSTETCRDYNELFDHEVSLCRRARYARLRAGVPSWWDKQFQNADNSMDEMFLILLIATWGSSTTIMESISIIDNVLLRLSEKEWSQLYESVQNCLSMTRDQHGIRSISARVLPDLQTARTAALLSLRFKEDRKADVFFKYLVDYQGEDKIVLQLAQEIAIDLLATGLHDLMPILEVISRSYKRNVVSDIYYTHRFVRASERTLLSDSVAEIIAANPDIYPSFLVKLAEHRCRSNVGLQIIPIGEIAKMEGWFSN